MREHKCCHHHGVWFRALVLLAVTAIVIVSVVMALKNNEPDYLFSVTDTGKVTAIPDIAAITVGVYTDTKKTAADAVKENTEMMNGIIEALKSIDIEKKDITTSSYNLNPVYDWTDQSGRTLKGYEIRQEVTIKVRDLDKVGKAIEVTTEKGANQIGGIGFTIDDPQELRKEAIKIAIEKAKIKAQELAMASGLEMGEIVNIYENSNYFPSAGINKVYADEAFGMGGGGDIPTPTIEVGEQEIAVEVTLVYKVK